MKKLSLYFFLMILLSSCASYAPPKINKDTGEYVTEIQLEPGAIQTENTDVDLSQYRFVYLTTNTNVYPKRFEYFVREALVGSGFKHILNRSELSALISSTEQLANTIWLVSEQGRSELSQKIGPALQIKFESIYAGGSSQNVKVSIKDMTTGDILLSINHLKKIWTDVDTEAYYPVINAIKQWVIACNNRQEGI